jgi:sec-independent protein translocase protein TatC
MMLKFLLNFNSSAAVLMPRISNYVNTVTRVFLFVGLIFETPLVIMGLAKLGLVSPQWLAARRKWWILLSFIFAAVISPTVDALSQTTLAVPLILLMELGIILARFVYKRKREQLQPA